MEFTISEAFLFFSAVYVGGILAVFTNWWISGYYSDHDHTEWSWKTGRCLAIFVLIFYFLGLAFLLFYPPTVPIEPKNNTVPNNSFTCNISNPTIKVHYIGPSVNLSYILRQMREDRLDYRR